MPEIKNQFTGGKMNKDLDERLIRNGEYRDAMNIQVSTSEDSDVGTVQNIPGNLNLSESIRSTLGKKYFTENAVCVGAVSDEKNDKLYWFVRDSGGEIEDPDGPLINEIIIPFDGIFEYSSNGNVAPVLIDINLNVLRFKANNIITGISVIDGMIFWTDGVGEPKKINIQRSIAGTNSNGRVHTTFINDKRTESFGPIKEEHITVIKKAPTTAPTVELISERDPSLMYSGVMRITTRPVPMTVPSTRDGISTGQEISLTYNDQNTSSMWIPGSPQNHHYDFSNLSVGDYFDTYIETDINGDSGFVLDWSVDDILLFKEFGGQFYETPPSIPLRDYSVKARIRRASQAKANNVKISKDFSAGADESYTETEYSVTWTQGASNQNKITLYHRSGFDGIIKNIQVFDVDANNGIDIMLNGNFDADDTTNVWTTSKCEENLGTTQDSSGNTIDPATFPCFPGNHHYGNDPWEITYVAGGGGYAKAADGLHLDTDGYWVSPRTSDSNGISFVNWADACSRSNIDAAEASLAAPNVYPWSTTSPNNFPGLSPINPLDGSSITSSNPGPGQPELGGNYSIINQHGYLYMEGVPVVKGTTYEIRFTIADTGHTYGRGNGQILLANHGIIDPWKNANYFTDIPEDIALNGSFITPDGNGDEPKNWGLGTGFTYVPGEHYIDCYSTGGAGQWKKVNQNTALGAVENDVTYEVSFELTNVGELPDGTIVPSGGVYLGLAGRYPAGVSGDPLSSGDPFPNQDFWRTPTVYTSGVHTFTITTSQPNAADGSNLGASSALQGDGGNRIFLEGTIEGVSGNLNGFIGRIHNISVKKVDAPNANVRCEVLEINNPSAAPSGIGELKYAVDRLDNVKRIFEFKFPRFAYRYQYEDKEYSTMSPFSPVAFVPGNFVYHPKEGYNLGMTNKLIEANIKDFKLGIPDGVIAIDILYKDDVSPNIYVVDTIRPRHTALASGVGNTTTVWDKGEYTISSEQISSMLPSNQLLRSWDAVPKKALAQDVSGNRIIYGNYTQGFDLKYGNKFDEIVEYYPDFSFDILNTSNPDLTSQKSIKSLREYQLGIVFVDKYGRETPVISNSTGTKVLEKKEAEKINQIQIGFKENEFPQNLKYFKFFVKETSNQYYNLAMDRWYDAEDGGVWLAFPSSDRNKVDIDTFLILKKAEGASTMVEAEAKYKILDIQSNAPNFIKLRKLLTSVTEHRFVDANNPSVFGSSMIDVPRVGAVSFKMNYKLFHDSSGSNLDEINDGNLYIGFESPTGNTTKRYRISKITNDYDDGVDGADLTTAQYSVIITERFGDDINLITDDPLTGLNPTKIEDGTKINIYRYTEENSAKFDGRFFVKISVDLEFQSQVISPGANSGKFTRVGGHKLYYLSPENSELHRSELTGLDIGIYANDFGRFAPFFRNYNSSPTRYNSTSATALHDLGQYRFGSYNYSTEGRPWLKELSHYTSWLGGYNGVERNDDHGNSLETPDVKVADSHGWNVLERQGVFNELDQQEAGDVWFIDGGPYHGENASSSGDNLHWADGDTRLVSGYGQAGEGAAIDVTESGATFFDIAIGGIYNTAPIKYGLGGKVDGFWDITNGGNSSYQGVASDLTKRFSPGQKFRFREDPNQEVYTIQQNVENKRRVRMGTIRNDESPDDNYGWYHPGPNRTPSGANPIYVNSNPVGTSSPPDNYPRRLAIFARQLSPNFSRGWKSRVLNSSGTGAVNWNPIGPLGPIENGLKLTTTHSGEASSNAITEVSVIVDSLVAEHVDGTKHNITIGMIMESHSNAATNCVFDGSAGKEYLAIKRIDEINNGAQYRLNLCGYSVILVNDDVSSLGLTAHKIFSNKPVENEQMVFSQPTMNGYSQYSTNRINAQDPAGMNYTNGNAGIMAIGYNLDFVEEVDIDSDSGSVVSENPAVWETEPKESINLDIYHEASGYNPLEIEQDTRLLAIPLGSTVETVSGEFIEEGTTVSAVNFDESSLTLEIVLFSPSDGPDFVGTLVEFVDNGVTYPYITNGDQLKITKPNGDVIIVTINEVGTIVNNRTTTFKINTDLYGLSTKYILNWHNCYSFGNGVESNRIRDNFNLPFISNGPKVSTTLEGNYNEEHRKYGLIYSGIYNSNSGINNLNQFIAAEKITKDINPIYGSIQKLHSRDSDLVTLCEDKCLRILANKDAVFNADGNTNLTATNNVLGQTIPFSGEYGISKNPESFASESYRVYFTDKIRGAVIRLSKDGLTPISMYGMKDWFKDNLKLSSKLIGSYDDKKEEYNITLNRLHKTVSYKEDVKGWVSFKSFEPEFGISMANNYYTMKGGALYQHHREDVNRNTFYEDKSGGFVSSSLTAVLNTRPGVIKSFHTLNYEGSQSRINPVNNETLLTFPGSNQPPTNYNDQEYYNLSPEDGWYVHSTALEPGIKTDQDEAYTTDFIEKEGKWFANINKFIDTNL